MVNEDFIEAYQNMSKNIHDVCTYIELGVITFKYNEDEGVTYEGEFFFTVPTNWLCGYLDMTEEETLKWVSEESNSEDNTDIFWEAIDGGVIGLFHDCGVTGILN